MNQQYIYRLILRDYEVTKDKNERLFELRGNKGYKRLTVVDEAAKRLKELGPSIDWLDIRYAASEEIEKVKREINKNKDRKTAALASVGLTEE